MESKRNVYMACFDGNFSCLISNSSYPCFLSRYFNSNPSKTKTCLASGIHNGHENMETKENALQLPNMMCVAYIRYSSCCLLIYSYTKFEQIM